MVRTSLAAVFCLLLVACGVQIDGGAGPLADAGPDVELQFSAGIFQELRGKASGGAEIATWDWQVVGSLRGASATLTGSGPARRFIPSAPGDYLLRLTVSDATGLVSPPDYSKIRVRGPSDALTVVATATVDGVQRPARTGETIVLGAQASGMRPTDGALTWSWQVVSAGAPEHLLAHEVLSDDAATVLVPKLEVERYTLVLEATAATASGRTGRGRVAIEVINADLPVLAVSLSCVANGGNCAGMLREGSSVTLTAHVLGADTYALTWVGEIVEGAAAGSYTPTFTKDKDDATLTLPQVQGDGVLLRVRVTASADGFTSASTEIDLKLEDTPPVDNPPVLTVGDAPTGLIIGDFVKIGAAVGDESFSTVRCEWSPSGIAVAQLEVSQADCKGFDARVLAAGTLSLTVTATDNGGQIDEKKLEVTIAGPLFVAGADRELGQLAATTGGNIYAGGMNDRAFLYRSATHVSGDVADSIGEGFPVCVVDTGTKRYAALAPAEPGEYKGNPFWTLSLIDEDSLRSTAPFVDRDDIYRTYLYWQPVALAVDPAGILVGGEDGELGYFAGTLFDKRRDATGAGILSILSWKAVGQAFVSSDNGLFFMKNLNHGTIEATEVGASELAGAKAVHLVAGLNSDLWIVTREASGDLRVLLFDASNPMAPARVSKVVDESIEEADDSGAPGLPGVEPAGSPYAGDLWIPEGGSGLSRIARQTGERVRLSVPGAANGGPLEYRSVLVRNDNGVRRIWIGTNQGLWVIP